jgi:Tfp pilus assembly protein PilZ
MSKEKRRFKRFDAFMNVQYRSQETKNIKGSALAKDLSRDGIKVNTVDQLKRGDLVDLVIHVPDDSQPVQTTGKVVWAKPCSGKDQGIDYGVSFLMIDPIDKFRVLDYAYNYWLETKVNDFADPEKITDLT